jgi:hypothetical protein
MKHSKYALAFLLLTSCVGFSSEKIRKPLTPAEFRARFSLQSPLKTKRLENIATPEEWRERFEQVRKQHPVEAVEINDLSKPVFRHIRSNYSPMGLGRDLVL